MPTFPTTGVERYCEKCFRKLFTPDENGQGMIVSANTVMITRTTVGEFGPIEVLVSEVYCTTCFPNGK